MSLFSRKPSSRLWSNFHFSTRYCSTWPWKENAKCNCNNGWCFCLIVSGLEQIKDALISDWNTSWQMREDAKIIKIRNHVNYQQTWSTIYKLQLLLIASYRIILSIITDVSSRIISLIAIKNIPYLCRCFEDETCSVRNESNVLQLPESVFLYNYYFNCSFTKQIMIKYRISRLVSHSSFFIITSEGLNKVTLIFRSRQNR